MRLISCELNEVAEGVLQKSEGGPTMGEECRKFFDMFGLREDENEVETKENAIDAKDFTISFRPTNYPPTLLPMMIIQCYPCLLDRCEIVRGLVRDLSKYHRFCKEDGRERRSCVCVLKSCAELVEEGSLISELLFQVSFQSLCTLSAFVLL
jgi:DNA-binding Lrp family transcriptional regulator